MRIKAIPLANLNCLHCTLNKGGVCELSRQKIKQPGRHYCLYIFRHYKEEVINESITNL